MLSQLPNPHYLVYCIVNIKAVYRISYFIFYVCLKLRFPDVETNPGRRRPVPDVYRILGSNVRSLAGNLSELTMALSQYDILSCSETLVSDMRHMSELLDPGFGARSCCAEAGYLGHEGWLHIRSLLTVASHFDGSGGFKLVC